MWKLSQFTVVHNLADRDLSSHNLVFNTVSSKGFTVVDSDWQQIVASLKAPDQAPAAVRRAITRLTERGFVVPQPRDEAAVWGRDFDRQRHQRRSIYPLLAVTTACNIGCTYCYEEGVEAETMSSAVIAGCLGWMERRIIEDGIEEIQAGLFGGEPLLYPRLLFEIMDGMADLRRRYGIDVGFYSSSNGMLLTDELAAKLARKGLTQLQISLDGPPEIHDQRRLGKRGQPSFEASLRGLRIAARHIRGVTVKLNFDRHNRRFAGQVFDLLVDEGLADRVNVKLETIAYQMPGSTVGHDPAHVIPPDSTELADAYNQLVLECQARGIVVSRDTAHTTPCMFSSDHGVILGPDGAIYKCISLVGRKEFAVGTVFDGEYDRQEYDRQMNTFKRLDECFEEQCPYVPVCAGGCAYEAITRAGSYEQRHCTKEFLERYHYLTYLVQHRDALEALGMRPLSAVELAASDRPPPAPSEGLVQIGMPPGRSSRERYREVESP
jgi:uncharacterized protein